MGIIMQHGLVENRLNARGDRMAAARSHCMGGCSIVGGDRLNARGPLIDYEQPGGTAWGDAAWLAETVHGKKKRSFALPFSFHGGHAGVQCWKHVGFASQRKNSVD